jgi:hypothetical protein
MNAQFTIPAIQFTLDDALAERAKQAALVRVEEHAAPGWKEYALETVKRIATGEAEFCTDRVLDELKTATVWTHELRALGPVMLRAARAGYIAPTARFVNSQSVSRHKAPKRVWKSLLYERNYL